MVILSNKDEWRVYPTELVKRSKDGLVSVRNTLEELENAGYVRTYKKSLGRGKGVEYFRSVSYTHLTLPTILRV